MQNSTPPKYAGVILDRAVGFILDYAIPLSLQEKIKVGSRVIVPIKNTLAKGTVWHLKQDSHALAIKNIEEIAIEPSVLTPDLIKLANWMSSYYAAPLHKVLIALLPKHIRGHEKEALEKVVKSNLSKEESSSLLLSLKEKSSPQQKLLTTLLQRGGTYPVSRLLKEANVSQSPLNTLLKKGVIYLDEAPKIQVDPFEADYFISSAKTLSQEQQEAFLKIETDLKKGSFAPHLLYGVTGSGKTEVYLQAIELALSLNKGIIFLVPEIALASQTLERLKSRFEERIAILHHRLSEGEKKESWHAIHTRRARIVVGARSAIFCPVPELGLIIVDEEHDPAYKHMGDSPNYHARDLAVMRGKLCEAVVLLGSATPSLESYQNALAGKYVLSTLTQRPENAVLPTVHIVDMKEECLKQKRKALFSDALLSALKKRLQIGEQSLLLLNRRGYHTSQICLQCSHICKCPNCDSSLIFHLEDQKLACHLCDYEIPPPKICPSCQGSSTLQFRGAGTELVEKVLYRLFPECRVLRMDADTTKKKDSHEAIFKKFRSGKADILVGTQMIAKGLHFPLVTLVGVLDADINLSIPDFRASETLFQLITQVAGRAGRSDLPGEVFIQTLVPTQATLLHAAKQDYLAFFAEELEIRKMFSYPPFTHLIKVSLSGLEEEKTKQQAEQAQQFLVKKLPSSFTFYPVVAPGHAKIENYYRFQFLIKSPKILAASATLLELQNHFKNRAVRLGIDIDPLTTFF